MKKNLKLRNQKKKKLKLINKFYNWNKISQKFKTGCILLWAKYKITVT